MKTIALTGGSGSIGSAVRKYMISQVGELRIVDVADPGTLEENETWHAADITDVDSMTSAFAGVDGIVHMAGLRSETDLESIVRVNVMGTYNVFEAARRSGVSRVVYGSSNHVDGFYPRTTLVDPQMPMRPDTRYGLSKCWGELTAGMFYDKHGIETLSIRIGNAAPRPRDRRALSMWVSPRDLAALILIGLNHPQIRCNVVYGVSKTAEPWWDNSAATALGYTPQDEIAAFAEPGAFHPEPADTPAVVKFFQGGGFCMQEHDGVVRLRTDD
ncbi:NAD(P)-dependent oxidoreductase [Rhizobium hidalgonense]|uniref:NAD(P)-dependent oxidoreductase n=1 Tax=Rhizobium hidalgonense TaxID=1538159 RepID=A0AAJ2GTJ0_9HYPH|nr:NAD(P)-dependent oxidoreductase [Rhizobium hidalgonense]MDR9774651.1 NAD(P)-dependent oxidoreductase [Rhizobium hidalgonense]MDR9814817.1 NAD(P)-dependent oxidoreductase [Rhizobium hidalgonense]MDR9818373.1 NAD(P)-dependent oxidoreductase [Rhizobium hidalgonense]